MARLKTFAIPIGFCIFALGALLVAIGGVRNEALAERLHAQQRLAAEIPALTADPKNEAIIAAQERWQREFDAECAELWKTAREINVRQPLLPDVFPAGAPPHKRVEFALAYHARLAELLRGMRAGGPVTDEETAAAEQDLDEWRRMVAEETGENAPVAVATPRPHHGLRPPHRPHTATVGGADTPARRLATLEKSRQLRCYAELPRLYPPLVADAPRSPTVEALWFAQVTLWIQEDVLETVAEINAAAAEIPGAPEGVAASPIKRIDGMQVYGYFTKHGTVRFDQPEEALSGQTQRTVHAFTHAHCDEFHDVVEWQLMAVIDARDLLALLDALARRNFHTCVGLHCSAVDGKDREEGYYYGTDPLIRVNLEFETYLLREVYDEMTPPAIVEVVHRDR